MKRDGSQFNAGDTHGPVQTQGFDVLAIHHHMTDVQPVVTLCTATAPDPAARLALGVRAAVDLLGTSEPRPRLTCFSAQLTSERRA